MAICTQWSSRYSNRDSSYGVSKLVDPSIIRQPTRTVNYILQPTITMRTPWRLRMHAGLEIRKNAWRWLPFLLAGDLSNYVISLLHQPIARGLLQYKIHFRSHRYTLFFDDIYWSGDLFLQTKWNSHRSTVPDLVGQELSCCGCFKDSSILEITPTHIRIA